MDVISLGEAFIDIRANTAGFKRDLSAQLKGVLTEAQAQANASSKAMAGSARAAGDAVAKSARDGARVFIEAEKEKVASARAADRAIAASAKEAAAEQAASLKALQAIGRLHRADATAQARQAAAEAKAINAATVADAKAAAKAQEDIAAQLQTKLALLRQRQAQDAEAYAATVAASKAATRAQEEDIARLVASAAAGAQRMAAAEIAAYAEIAAASKAAAEKQAADSRFAAAEAKRAAEAQKASFGGQFLKGLTGSFKNVGSSIGSSIGKSVSSIPKDIFGAVTTSAKFATIGVLGLGAAMVGIGLVNAAKQQAAVVGFTALAAQISATTDATTGLTNATQGLTREQSRAIGQDFENRLIQLANNSALSQAALQDTSQALLALGFNGDQSVGIIRDIGNALAASGKTGGGLNEDLKGIVVAFSQIKGSGRLLAQDLNQITTRIPSAGRVQVYTELAKALHLAGANAKEGTPAFKAMTKEVQKLAKAGDIGSEVAIAAITKALEQVPGAAADAVTGLDALGRQNETLTGRFEALKDNVRSALAKAFLLPGEPGGPGGGKSLSDRLADQLGLLIPQITDAIAKIGPPLSKFVEQFTGLLIRFLPPLIGLIGTVFGLLGRGLDGVNSALSGTSDGFRKFGDVLARINIGPALGEAFQAVAAAIPPIIEAIGGIIIALTPVLSIVGSIARVLIAVLTPIIQGVASVFGAIGIVLAPIADALRPIADAIQRAFGNEVVQQILTIVGQVAALTAVFLSVGGAIGAASVAIGALLPILAVLAGELIAIVGIPELIALALALLVIGFIKAWQASETFRDIVVGAMKVAAELFILPVTLMIGALQLFLKALEKTASFGGKLNPFHALVGGIKDAEGALGDIQGAIQGTIGKLDNLKNVGIETKGNVQNLSSAIAGFNSALGLTGSAALNSSADVIELQSAIAALPAEKRILINVVTIQSTIDSRGSNIVGGPLNGSTVHDSEATTAQVPLRNSKTPAQIAQSTADELLRNAARLTRSGGGGGGSGGGGGGAGSSKAADAKKAAADRLKQIIATFRQAIKDILAGLDSDFKKALVSGTRKEIDSTLDALSKKIASVFKAGGKKRPSGLLNDIAKDNTKLKNLADQRDKILDRLAKATDRFNEVKSSIQDFASVSSIDLESIGLAAKSATDATEKLADLSRLRIILPGQDAVNIITGGKAGTAGTDAIKAGSAKFAAALAAKLKMIKDFQANIKKLIAEGLNKTTIDQIISAGPEAGGLLAQSLAGASTATVNSINASQKAIDAAATKLANTAVDSLFRSGKSVVDGLIAGLKEKRDEIRAAMKQIADDLVAEIKKALKVKSPSQVMHAIGRHVGAGLHLGMASKSADISAAARDMAAAAVPRIAPLSMPNLTRMAGAEARAQLNALNLPRRQSAAAASMTTHNREINAPITNHFHGTTVDPHATAKHMARVVGGLR